MGSFSEATALRAVDDGHEVTLDPQWAVGDKIHGGYLMAIVGRAVGEVATHPHTVAASTVFLRPPLPGPATVTVEPLRTGGRHAYFRARLTQDGRPCLEALVTRGTLDDAAPTWASGPAPAVADEQDCVYLPAYQPGAPFRVPLLDVVEHRLERSCAGFLDGQPSGRGETSGWLRLADGADWDHDSLLVALDPAPPVSLTLGMTGWAPTVSLTAYLRRLPAPGPVQIVMQAREVTGGRMDETVHIWDTKGELVAQATQLAGVR
ncbi:thioesterase family protein [Catenuloplanes japonicus]|uniref:thioesterase family protein n=1 Tax=Catenuloplanes japonicus TaxID=33876 RepID=UPI0005256A14|nr:thioesterase family protein [Catenuloplanes japonicus]